MKTSTPAEAKAPLSQKKVKALKETLNKETVAAEPKAKLTIKEKLALKKATKGNPTTETKKDTDTKNLKDTVAKAVTQVREVKYIYPADCITTDDKKKWRQATRNKDKAFAKEMSDLVKKGDDKAIAKLEKSIKAFRKEKFLVP